MDIAIPCDEWIGLFCRIAPLLLPRSPVEAPCRPCIALDGRAPFFDVAGVGASAMPRGGIGISNRRALPACRPHQA